ncbi:MAG: electron transport complex subunit RsxC [Mariprofundales bacterium]|nr:electron transport complex subunit RsxC [Mariprofundales bacterium]
MNARGTMHSWQRMGSRWLAGLIPLARPGVHPDDNKVSASLPIADAPLPSLLTLPVRQHIGEACEPIVTVGDRVLRGQKIAKSQGYISTPIHAPTSGRVVKIEENAIVHPSGIGMLSIFIEPDGEDRWLEPLPAMVDYEQRDPAEVREQIRRCGIAGLGGALFPTFIKLVSDERSPIDTLILNGVECEPWLTCDHRLMVEDAERIVEGLKILHYLVKARRTVIAIEDNKEDAAEAMRAAVSDAGVCGVTIEVLPTLYPQGSEKQLVELITGREIPAGKLPVHIGALCENVATTAAIADAVLAGRPLIDRIVTVSGDAMPQPANLRVRIGTPIDHLLCQQGLDNLDGVEIIQGGPMMGEKLHHFNAPITKGSNGILVMQRRDVGEESPCIRCGHCVQVCPVGLLPNALAAHCRNDRFAEAEEFELFDCIECGACSFVCPAKIPLVHYFRYGKGQVAAIRRANAFADLSRQRSEQRERRLQREKEERAARRRARSAAKPVAAQSTPSSGDGDR